VVRARGGRINSRAGASRSGSLAVPLPGDEYSFPADVWALGLTIVTCALGRFPYDDSGGYWGILSALKDREPPSIPSDEVRGGRAG
jgi:serine/threonine protein kinase